MHPQGPSFSGFYYTNITASWGEITDGTRADVSIKPDKVWRHYWKLLHSIVREKGQSGSVEQRRLLSFIFRLRGKKKMCLCACARVCVMAPTRALTFQSSDNAVAKCSHFLDSRGGEAHMQTGLLPADTSYSSLPVQGGCDSTDRTATFREVRLSVKNADLVEPGARI